MEILFWSHDVPEKVIERARKHLCNGIKLLQIKNKVGSNIKNGYTVGQFILKSMFNEHPL